MLKRQKKHVAEMASGVIFKKQKQKNKTASHVKSRDSQEIAWIT